MLVLAHRALVHPVDDESMFGCDPAVGFTGTVVSFEVLTTVACAQMS